MVEEKVNLRYILNSQELSLILQITAAFTHPISGGFLLVPESMQARNFSERGTSPKENSLELCNCIFCIMHAVAYPRILFAILN